MTGFASLILRMSDLIWLCAELTALLITSACFLMMDLCQPTWLCTVTYSLRGVYITWSYPITYLVAALNPLEGTVTGPICKNSFEGTLEDYSVQSSIA